jgi:hypothetical protein
VQTEKPTWLEEAYKSPINLSDTGIMKRNLLNKTNVLIALTMLGCRSGKVVDFAGGYGLLVRTLRDIGIDAYWNDPFTSNLVAKGFEYSGEKGNLVTAFEAFEHFENPIKEIQSIFQIAPNLLFSTEIIPNIPPKADEWWYYGLEHGQHIGFLSLKTLNYIAEKFNKFVVTDNKSIHLLSEKKVNKYQWEILIKTSKIFPRILTLGLKSKTWSDHMLLKGR